MLNDYFTREGSQPRILLLSDGAENTLPSVDSVLPDIVNDGITIDTVIYG